MSQRQTNVRTAIKVGEPTGARTLRQARIADMAALAHLPLSVRCLLNELTVELSAASVLAHYQSIARQARELGGSPYDAEVWTLRKLAVIEATDLDAFAARYDVAHRLPLPHKAAEASVLRYGPLERHDRARNRQPLARRGFRRVAMPSEVREAP